MIADHARIAPVGIARINSRAVEIQPGDTILTAAARMGVEIPTLCHDPALPAEGGCRLCVVHSEHHDHPLAACHTPLAPGMDLQTHEAGVETLRRSLLQMYWESAGRTGFDPTAARPGRFLDLLARYRVRAFLGRAGGRGKKAPRDQSHPMIHFQADACLGCRICLSTCDRLVDRHVFETADRGGATLVRPAAGLPLIGSPCTACGACVDRCPTGALMDRDRRYHWSAESEIREVESVCGYCSVGCRISVKAVDDMVREIGAIRGDSATNPHGELCQKGRFGHGYNTTWERLDRPMLRQGAGFRAITWEEAVDFLADRLTAILDQSGPESFAALGSTRASTESNYLLQKFCRAVIGSPHIDAPARASHHATREALVESFGVPAATACFADIERVNCLVVVGADPDTSHPVLAARLRRAVAAGARLIVIDPRRSELAEVADIFLQNSPGTDLPLLHALAGELLASDGEADENGAVFGEFVRDFPLAETAAFAGVEETEARGCIDLLDASRHSALFVIGTGLSRQENGAATIRALLNLAILTGNECGILPLGGQNNLQGCLDAGAAPDLLPGQADIRSPAARRRIESVWGKALPGARGFTAPEMFAAAANGALRAMWIMGHDAVHAHPDQARTIAGLGNLDLLVVQDLFYTETSRHAHLLLPAASIFEQSGVHINAERRAQLARPSVSPPGQARPDWVPLSVIARRLGTAWAPFDAADLWRELARVAPETFGGISHRRLEETPAGIQWPCPTIHHGGTARLSPTRLSLSTGVPVKAMETPDRDFPLWLQFGRRLEHHNSGGDTRRNAGRHLVDRDHAFLHPDDAAALGLEAGDRVRIESRRGEIRVACALSDRLPRGRMSLSPHFPQTKANRLTGDGHFLWIAVRVSAAG